MLAELELGFHWVELFPSVELKNDLYGSQNVTIDIGVSSK